GLEFAAIARAKGKPVHIVELTDRVMGRVVCHPTSAHFAAVHRGAGVAFSFSTQVTAIEGAAGKVTHIALGDGRKVPADLVVVARTGVAPNVELAEAAALAIENGIVVDERLSTADPLISAIGDCAVFPSRHALKNPVRLEAVQNATDHARCVAARILGKPRPY